MEVAFEKIMSADKTTPIVAAKWCMSEEGAVDAPGGENAQSSAWILRAGESTWTVAEFQERFGRLFDALYFGWAFADERNAVLLDHRGVCRDTDNRAWHRRCATVFWWCARLFKLASLFYIPIVFYDEEIQYLHLLRTLVPRVEEQFGLEKCYDLCVCCFGGPYDRFYHIWDVTKW